MKKRIAITLIVCALGITGAYGIFRLFTYISLGKPVPTTQIFVQTTPAPDSNDTESMVAAPVPFKLELVADNLFVPWSLVFTSSDRMLVTERNGNVRVIEKGNLQEKPLYTFSNVSQKMEEGLMGMALHPDYETNKYIYFAYAYPKGNGMAVRVVRFMDAGTALQEEKTIIDNLPAAKYHAGTRIKFGPDRKLYISTGDATQKDKAQDIKALNGKILRLNDDGTIPSGNPFPNSPVFSYGHRNSQGFDWHPVSHVLYETEHGPSLIDGPAGGDEINVIKAGKNYGWPEAHHEIHIDGREDPKVVFTPAVAPADMTFYDGKLFPQFKNNFFFAALKGEGIYRVVVSEQNSEVIEKYEKMNDIVVGRVREVVEAPNGEIYFTTSNRDNRGTLQQNDDKVYRLVAK